MSDKTLEKVRNDVVKKHIDELDERFEEDRVLFEGLFEHYNTARLNVLANYFARMLVSEAPVKNAHDNFQKLQKFFLETLEWHIQNVQQFEEVSHADHG